jgi:hypothetical protein
MGSMISMPVVDTVSCANGVGMCAATKHGFLILSDEDSKLHMHSLADGSLVRSIGGKGSGKGQFSLGCGGLCMGLDGDSVLVADCWNNRVHQVHIVDGSWVRFVGKGVVHGPQFVDCNADVIVVTEICHRISVLSEANGSLLARFGSLGSDSGQLTTPCGLRLLGDGETLVVVDSWNHRLCFLRWSGGRLIMLGSRQCGLLLPFDVLPCTLDDGMDIASFHTTDVIHWSKDDVAKGMRGLNGTFHPEAGSPVALLARTASGDPGPSTLAALPDGGMAVRSWAGRRLQVFLGRGLRIAWVTVCAKYVAQRDRHPLLGYGQR